MAALLTLAATVPSTGQTPDSVDAALLEAACRANATDQTTLEDCLVIVRTVLAPDGRLVLPAAEPSTAPDGGGVGVTQSTGTVAVTLLAVAWEAALYPREDVDVVAVELAFEGLAPETYVDLAGLSSIDADGFIHTWGAIHRMGESPPGGYIDEGRKQRGWVGFEVPADTPHLEIEYRDLSGERLAWSVERPASTE